MELTITIKDEDLPKFSEMYQGFLIEISKPAEEPDDELWGVEEIAKYLGMKTSRNLYSNQRHYLPPDSLLASGMKRGKRWHKSDVIAHINKLRGGNE